MKRYPDAAESLRLKRERDEALERERQALAHRDAMQSELDAISRRLAERINRNNDVWLAASRLPGGLEALRGIPWTD